MRHRLHLLPPVGCANNPRARRRAADQGFVLVLVLWLVAGLAVAAAFISRYTLFNGQASTLLRDRVVADMGFESAKSEVVYALGVAENSRLGKRIGSTTVRVDGAPYHFKDGTQVTIQDARGLLDLNNLPLDDGRRLLSQCGAPLEAIPSLLDALADYVDADNLKRLHGAEADAYRAASLPEPANRPLRHIDEVWNVLGWPAIRDAWNAKDCDLSVTTLGDGGFNFNSAPRIPLLAKGVPPAMAEGLLAERGLTHTGAGSATYNYENFAGKEANIFASTSTPLPGRVYRVRHWSATGQWLQYWLEYPVDASEKPWALHQVSQGWSATPPKALASAPFPSIQPSDRIDENAALPWFLLGR